MIRMQSWKPQERKDMVVLIDTNGFMKVSVETRRYGLIYQINNIIEARSINSVPQLFYPDYLSVVK